MLTLAQASSYFDRIEVTDPFTGALLFKGQVEPFEDSKRDAYSAYRRVLSVAPDVAMPVHSTVNLMGQTWLVGAGEVDGMQQLHRRKFVLSPVTAQLEVSTLGQYLQGVSSRALHAAPYWNKDVKQVDVSSQQPQTYDVFLPSEVAARSILWDDEQAFLVLSPRPMPSGFTAAYSLRLDHAMESATLVSRTFNPVAGALVDGPTTSVPCLRVRWQSLFDYDAQTDERYKEGDVTLVMPAGCGVTTASKLTVGGLKYQVLAVDTMVDALAVHGRRAG